MAKDKAKEAPEGDAEKPEGEAAGEDAPKKGLINKLFGTKKMMMITGGGLLAVLLGIGGGLYFFVFSGHGAEKTAMKTASGTPQAPIVPPLRLHLIRRQEHPERAGDDIADALGGGGRCGLEDEGQEQRRLAHQLELRGGEPAVVDREFALLHAALQIGGEPVDGGLQHALIIAAADLRHPLGDRHHGADRRSAAGPAQQLDIGQAEFPKRRGNVSLGIEIEGDLAVFKRFFLDNGFEQPVLVGEVDIECPLGDAGGAGDLAHAGAVKAEIHEDLAGAGEDLAALRTIIVAGKAECSRMSCNHWFRFSGKMAARATPGNTLEGKTLYIGGVINIP